MERAKKFYESVFGVELKVQDFGNLIMAWFPATREGGGGSAGSLVKAEPYAPSHEGMLVYFHVNDIDKTLGKVAGGGGKIINTKRSIGERGFVGHFEDTEGNRVALLENAKTRTTV